MPKYDFAQEYDVVLIHRLHGFPFSGIEYFFVYPSIKKKGGYLITDSVSIPSIGYIVDTLAEDDMSEFVETAMVTAVLRRTDAPTFDQEFESWWLQRDNRHRISLKREVCLSTGGRIPTTQLDGEFLEGKLKARLG